MKARSNIRGFSLIELVVALAISAVLILVLLEISVRAAGGVGRAHRSIQLQGGGRSALQFMAVDLASRLAGTPVEIAGDAAAPWPCARLGFFRILAEGEPGDPGDVVFVRYEVVPVTESGAVSQHLRRSVWSSRASFAALKQGAVPAGEPLSSGVLAVHVVGFGLRPGVPNPGSNAGNWQLALSLTDELTARNLPDALAWRAQSTRGAALLGPSAANPHGARVSTYLTKIIIYP